MGRCDLFFFQADLFDAFGLLHTFPGNQNAGTFNFAWLPE